MILRWDIVTIGNLSRNRYWGESDAHPVRSALCTCTFVESSRLRLLVDPSISEAQAMDAELHRRTGLHLPAITSVFVTHAHGDHHAGLDHFSNANWFAAPSVAEAINKTGRHGKPVMPVGDMLGDDIDVIGTPGHTLDHHSLRLDCDGYSIVIAGDAVMTRDFWRHRQGYFNSADFALAARTMDHLASTADIIVPGHDNCFLSARNNTAP